MQIYDRLHKCVLISASRMVPLPPLKYALLVNTLRGHAAEFGVIAGKGPSLKWRWARP